MIYTLLVRVGGNIFFYKEKKSLKKMWKRGDPIHVQGDLYSNALTITPRLQLQPSA